MTDFIHTSNKERFEDIDGLCQYIFEHELEDMLECLVNEPLYVEEEIITEQDVEDINDNFGINPIVDRILDKACMNINNRHIYALAYRIYYDALSRK
jgi:hypothetical protein